MGTPVIAPDGSIYVGLQGEGAYDVRFAAINPDGSLKWQSAENLVYPTQAPAIGSDGTVYVGTQDHGQKVYAFNPDGTLKWDFAVGDAVYFITIGPDGTIYFTSETATLYALNPSGTVKWTQTFGLGCQWTVAQSAPAIGLDGTIYVTDECQSLYAVNPEGSLKWRKSFSPPLVGSGNISSATVSMDGTVYVAVNTTLQAFAPNGDTIWGTAIPLECGSPSLDVLNTTPAIAPDGSIIVTARVGQSHNLVAFHPDGTPKWAFCPASQESLWGLQTAIIGSDGTVYVGSFLISFPEGEPKANLYAVNDDGSLKWNFPAFNVESPAAIAQDGTVYVQIREPGTFAKLYAFGSPMPHIATISPSSGPVDTLVTLTGENFGATQESGAVSFQRRSRIPGPGEFAKPPRDLMALTATQSVAPAEIISWSDTQVQARVPSVTVGEYDVTVTTSTGTSNFVLFEVTALPVLSVSPNSLDFGIVPAGGSKDLSLTVQNAGGGTLEGSCTAVAPFSLPEGCAFSLQAGQSKLVKVHFSPTAAGIFTGEVSFTSKGGTASPMVKGEGTVKPHIESLSHSSGPVGTSVSIIGFNFGAKPGTSTVKFGSKKVTTTSWTETQVQSVAPSLKAGIYDVTITTEQGTSTAVPFTITPPPPSITGIKPTSGASGTVVTITGKNFGPAQGSVSFGSTEATINAWSDTQIKAIAPSQPYGTVAVTAVTSAESSNSDKTFTYLPPGPVLVVPGIYGSWSTKLFCNNKITIKDFELWLKSAALLTSQIKGTKIPKKWTIDPITFTYNSLIDTLKSNGFKPLPVPYDWRESNTVSVRTLMDAMDNAKKKYKLAKVDVVAHSMGGLVVRWYIQSSSYRGDINKFIMLGTPNYGGIDAYYAWEGGDVKGGGWGFELLMERASADMQYGCGSRDISDSEFIHAYIPSVKELLPTFPFLVFEGSGEPQELSCEKNTFLQYLNTNHGKLTEKGVDVAIFSGSGQETPEKLIISTPQVETCEAGTEWADGKPTGFLPSDGDGRVLSSQIAIEGVTVVEKPAEHGSLPDAFLGEIIEFLKK